MVHRLLVSGLGLVCTVSVLMGQAPVVHEAVCQRPDVSFCEDWEDGDTQGWSDDTYVNNCRSIVNVGGALNTSNALRHNLVGQCSDGSTPCMINADCPGGGQCNGWPGGNGAGCVCGGMERSLNEAPTTNVTQINQYYRFFLRFSSVGETPYEFFKQNPGGQKLFYPATYAGVGTNVEMNAVRNSLDNNDQNHGELQLEGPGHSPIFRQLGCVENDGQSCGTFVNDHTAPRLLADDTWYCVEWHLDESDPGQANGEVQVWINDQPYLHFKNVNLETGDFTMNRYLWFNEYFGGNPCSPHPPQRVSWDQIVVASQRIGCGTPGQEGPQGGPPAPSDLWRTDVTP